MAGAKAQVPWVGSPGAWAGSGSAARLALGGRERAEAQEPRETAGLRAPPPVGTAARPCSCATSSGTGQLLSDPSIKGRGDLIPCSVSTVPHRVSVPTVGVRWVFVE